MQGIQLDFGTRPPQRSRRQGYQQRKTDPLDGPRTTPSVSTVDRLAAGNLGPRGGLATDSTPEEIAALVRQRGLADQSHHYPHGRPTSLVLTLHDLERQFRPG